MHEINKLSLSELAQIEQLSDRITIDHSIFPQQLEDICTKLEDAHIIDKICSKIYKNAAQEVCAIFKLDFSTYHFYFLLEYDGIQTIFEYRTDFWFRYFYKNNLKQLTNCLKYFNKHQKNYSLDIYAIKLPSNNFLPIHHIFQTAKKEISFFSAIKNWTASHFEKILVFLILLFNTVFFGTIIAKSNIPFPSIESNFLTFLPTVLKYVLIEVILNWKFLILVGITYIGLLLYLRQVYRKIYFQHVINISALLFITSIAAFIWTIIKFSQTDIPTETYIGTTGYPKMVQSHDHNYTLLGSNNMVYDLQKSLTPKRCQKIIDSNNTTPYPFYFALIQVTNDDYSTFPNNSFTLKDDNMTYFDYNQSRRWAEAQCKNILASTSKTKVPQ